MGIMDETIENGVSDPGVPMAPCQVPRGADW